MTMEEKMAQVEAQAAAKAAGNAKADTDLITGHLDAEQLKAMKMPELKALANDMGLEYAFNIKKDDLVALIAAQPVQAEKTAIVGADVDPDAATGAANGLLVNTDHEADDQDDPEEDDDQDDPEEDDDQNDPEEDDEDPACVDVELKGRALVTYTGMVNLRDEDMNVVDQAMQGQVFPVVGKREKDGAVWYRVEDRHGKECLISADVVRYMA